ncbi:aminotransferase class IV [Pelosinus sp. sgz500959]|uniref:aminotransferase class IV n=1 Tax=Pelosinus sp. sgz500959 TaxID=3242472 RepID=UPI00366CB121
MQDNWIYLNDKMVLESEASISPFDHGFLYGHGLFETMRVYQGNVFCLEEHLKRLHASSLVLGWPEWFDAEVLSSAIYQTLEKNKLQEASLRLTVTRGIGASRPDPSTCGQVTVAVFAYPIQLLGADVYEQGWSMVTASIRRNLTSPLCGLKVANYLDHILAKSEARHKGANEALLLNTKGNVAEGTMCNVFFVIDDRLITPDEKSGLLPGITRALVLKIAYQAGLRVEERQVDPDELLGISEMFITSSLLEIMAVTILDQRIVKDGRPGKITKLLQKEYKIKTERSQSAT